MSTFQFADFSLRDDNCGQKICSDSVLFGSWAWQHRPASGTVLDIGSGSGLLALLTARACPEAEIIALENSKEACADAASNFASSPWSGRISLVEGNFSDYIPGHEVEAIICNPPFFSTGAPAAEASRADARHEGSLSYASAISYAARYLLPEGRLMLVGPAERCEEVVFEAEMAGLKLRRQTLVCTSRRKSPTRAFWEFRRIDGNIDRTVLSIREASGAYSEDYLALVGSLYKKLA